MECYWVTFTFTKLKTVLEGKTCSFIQPWTLESNTNQKKDLSWWNIIIISLTAVITFGHRWICEWMDHRLFNDILKSKVTHYWVLLEDVPTFSTPERSEYKIAMAYFRMLCQQTGLELNISWTEVFLGPTCVLSVPPKPTYKHIKLSCNARSYTADPIALIIHSNWAQTGPLLQF